VDLRTCDRQQLLIAARIFTVAAASGRPSNFWVEAPRSDLDASNGKGAGAPTVVVFTLAR